MGILSFFARRRNARVAARAANELAERSYAAVLGRVRRRATAMRNSEARGYVRSRALEIVHRELAALHDGRIKLEPAIQTEIIAQATEAVVVRALAELRATKEAKTGQRRAA
jgi:hypothetical protein